METSLEMKDVLQTGWKGHVQQNRSACGEMSATEVLLRLRGAFFSPYSCEILTVLTSQHSYQSLLNL